MSDMKQTTSSIAMIDRWNRRRQLEHLELQLIHWMEFYIPPNLVLIRRLTDLEHKSLVAQGTDYGAKGAYGEFVARTGECLAYRASYRELIAEAKRQRYSVTHLQ
jgi:hypothetical protein